MTTTIINESLNRHNESLRVQGLSNDRLLSDPESLKLLAQHAQADYLARSHIPSEAEDRLLELVMEFLPLKRYDNSEYAVIAHGTDIDVSFVENKATTFEAFEIDDILELFIELKKVDINQLTFRKDVSSGDVRDATGMIKSRRLELILSDPTDVRVSSRSNNIVAAEVVFEGHFREALNFLLQATVEDV